MNLEGIAVPVPCSLLSLMYKLFLPTSWEAIFTVAQVLQRMFIPQQRKWPSVVLACFWSGGFVFGILFFFLAGDSFVSLMRRASCCRVSIVSLLMANLLPFLISALAVYIHKPWLLYGCAFFRSCLLGFVSMGTLMAFGSAGWLVRLLLMFSDVSLAILLYLYWLRHISGLRRFSPVDCGGYAAAALLIGSIDHCFVAPLLVQLIDF